MALKKLQQRLPIQKVRERIEQAELLIYDRMCDNGGWNYGNSEVFGEKLWPYPDTTALALIATHNHRERRENQISLGVLKDLAAKTNSGLALSWTLVCLAVYGLHDTSLKNALKLRYSETNFLDETRSLAIAILALSDGARYLRI